MFIQKYEMVQIIVRKITPRNDDLLKAICK